ncbi:ATP-binding protein [Telmatospirillum sp.]|uniref:ATP-binding protein n=1 Tax=Telmatospirillum sp. TaxID=2079197 RepID=UPI0028479602|nr:ATP-binding protein [Telmatospirillum sp.]MDR3436851.1 ATP-binding protein [Telmatospirillum sp.]
MVDVPPLTRTPDTDRAGGSSGAAHRKSSVAARTVLKPRQRYAILSFLIWMICAWFLATEVIAWRDDAALLQADRQSQQTIEDMTMGIRRSLAVFHGIPAVLGRDADVRSALERFASNASLTSLSRSERQALWERDPGLKTLDQLLAGTVEDIHAFSVIWVMNIHGECVAASNAAGAETFVGTSYLDRQYFQEALNGKLGHQYAVGRNTNVPGLFFSAPVTVNGRVIGAVATKIDLSYLLSWVNQDRAFISDNYGVIVLAQDKRLEMSALPNAAVESLTPAERMNRYRQSDFLKFDVSEWPDPRYPTVKKIAGYVAPVLMRTVDIADEDLSVTIMRPVPPIAEAARERIGLFLIFTAVVAAAIVCVLFSIAVQHNQNLTKAEQGSRELAEDLKRRIDERARIEEIRQASEIRLRAITDSLVECVVVVDHVGQVVFANRSARLLFNVPTTVEGMALDDLLRPKIDGTAVAFADSPWQKVLENKKPIGNDNAEFILSSERVTAVAYACVPMEDDERSRCVVISFRDISALKQAQREALQSARLISIGELAAGIAHEINTPAQYISDNLRYIDDGLKSLCSLLTTGRAPSDTAAVTDGKAEVVTESELADLLVEMPQAVAESREGVAQIARIVLSMREFSHPGSSSRTATDLNRSIENILTVSHNAWKHSAEVERDLDPLLPQVTCHAGEINQVFLNLILNAAQAIETSGKKGPGKITITTRQDGDYVEILVADSGAGVPMAIRDRIFDPFFTTKPVGKGTGQGLAICRDVVVVKHGGTLTVGGVEGEGAVFVVRLPIEGTGTSQV